MNENQVFASIPDDQGHSFRVHATVSENSLEVLIIQDENAFKSSVHSHQLENSANQQQLTLQEYTAQLLNYIKITDENIALNFNGEDFTIYKIIAKDTKWKFFNVKMAKSNFSRVVTNLLDDFYSDKNSLSQRLKELQRSKNELESKNVAIQQQLEEVLSRNKTDQDELFGKFLLILNEKKLRIQHLTELLEAFKTGTLPTAPTASVGKRKRRGQSPSENPHKDKNKAQKLEVVSDSPSSDSENEECQIEEYNTDEEVQSNDPKPSTSSAQDSTNSNSDLLDILDNKDVGKIVLKLPPREAARKTTKKDNSSLPPITNNKADIQVQKEQIVNQDPVPASQKMELNTQELLDML